MNACTKCRAELPPRFFQVVAGRVSRRCTPCISAESRLRSPLAPSRRDPEQIALNHVAHIWQQRTRWPLLAHQENKS